ncbi:MAG: hypothetical protein B5766_06195 [Candidatus Lumbricidophila eiseniae]|uniref:HTH luxR-type domain-containing protein n=1 Tax=Candidatus Lumbricidiphila eiseniae TaxID=1969409 RepID=A0A2A6FRB0_9MICO|nr:MAG: hypothetical protein B5766_06195 [Candidatus Lumbricidophila eiseniae]
MKLEILVVADAILRAEALSSLLATCPDFTVTARSFEAQRPSGTREPEPSVIVCDTTDALMSAPEKIKRLVREKPDRQIIAVTAVGDDLTIECFASGAAGVVRWDSTDGELFASVREVAAGHLYVSRAVLRGLIGSTSQPSVREINSSYCFEGLTAREISIVSLLLLGMTNQEIAGKLFLAEQTVKSHFGRIMAKWGVRDRVQVVLKAMHANPHNLTQPEDLQ